MSISRAFGYIFRTILLISVTAWVSAIAAQNAEDFASATIRVQRGTDAPIPINHVGILTGGERVQVTFDDSYTDKSGIPTAFKDLLYRKIAVLFVPAKMAMLPFMQKYKRVAYQEANVCAADSKDGCTNGTFEFTAPAYSSFPMVFLISKKGYKSDLLKLVNVDNFGGILNSGEIPYEIHLAEQKLEFLANLSDVINVKKLESRKILQALFETAKDRFKFFEGTSCEKDGQTAANKDADEKKPGSKASEAAVIKKQLGCLLDNTANSIKAFQDFRDSGGLAVKSIVYLLANTGLSVLVDKFPSLGIYFTIAKFALIILDQIFKKAAIQITSVFIHPLSEPGRFVLLSPPPKSAVTDKTIQAANAAGTQVKIASKDKPQLQGSDDNPVPTSGSERALFFVPMPLNGGIKFTPNQLQALTPKPQVPCLDRGVNGWLIPTELLTDPLFGKPHVSISGKKTDGTDVVVQFDKPSIGLGFVSVELNDEKWEQLAALTNLSGKLSFEYAGLPISLDVPVARAATDTRVEFSQDSLGRFRRGNDAILRFKGKETTPGCVDKITYTFGDVPLNKDAVDDADRVTLTKAETESLKAGPGTIVFHQYGGSDISVDLALADHYPTIVSALAAENDNTAIITGERLDQFKNRSIRHVLTYENDDGVPTGVTNSFTIEPRSDKELVLHLSDGAIFPAEGTKFRINMQLASGESVKSPSVSQVVASRPKFQTAKDCQRDATGDGQLIPTKADDATSVFGLGQCVTSIDTDTIAIPLTRIAGGNYSFSPGTSYQVNVLAIPQNRVGKEYEYKTPKTTITDPATNINVAMLRLPIKMGQFEPERNLLKDGVVIRVQVIDPMRGNSDWFTIGQDFVTLPTSLLLDCSSNNSCKVSGDLTNVTDVAVSVDGDGKPLWSAIPPGTAGPVSLRLIDIPKPLGGDPYYFYIRVVGSDRPIKIRFLGGNTSFVYKEASTKVVTQLPNQE